MPSKHDIEREKNIVGVQIIYYFDEDKKNHMGKSKPLKIAIDCFGQITWLKIATYIIFLNKACIMLR